ncbi:DUF447 domain-containing protein [Natronolimnohabitans innermongolicus]|uniref:DUF447 family protein n=1 Tax=Natronolimnohabitans innermongolicus JCM 12255 TaxID=1227499 RepID=L9WI72_9EURY|nr:DUF447 domain-containing protein [Natronolimnohabitans innermongolicus]ELY49210.1 hypothetical protein C493_20977 [Natronolimnohabitans innermongolicus JCM 12255]
MSDECNGGDSRRADTVASDAPDAEWPVALSGVTETVVTTLGPNGLWNAAPLGVFAGGESGENDGDNGDETDGSDGAGEAEGEHGTAAAPATARTWGNTRTRRNFHRQGEGYVQFVDDPVVFADAALSISESEEPVLESTRAWARVAVEPVASGTDDGTEWEQWELRPLESGIESTTVPTIDRGFGAVIEATVAASRLGVPGYDDAELRERLEYFASVVDRAGGPRERDALERVREHAEW